MDDIQTQNPPDQPGDWRWDGRAWVAVKPLPPRVPLNSRERSLHHALWAFTALDMLVFYWTAKSLLYYNPPHAHCGQFASFPHQYTLLVVIDLVIVILAVSIWVTNSRARRWPQGPYASATVICLVLLGVSTLATGGLILLSTICV